ncbi:lipocalin-like domain-containing protein [Flaviaesturariibacter terrae]
MKNTILFLLPLLAACSKGGRADAGPALTGAWQQTAEQANGQSLWNTYYHDPCELDDRWIFAADGSYEVADSGMACNFGSARHGSWRLENGHLLLDSITYEIREQGERTLTLECERSRNGFRFRYQLGFTRP